MYSQAQSTGSSTSQIDENTAQANNFNINGEGYSDMILTGVPFLLIAPDPVSSAMGNGSLVTTPNLYDGIGNTSKLIFLNSKLGTNVTYFPWFANVSDNNMYMITTSGFYKFLSKHIATYSFRYLNYGKTNSYNSEGYLDNNQNNPVEFAANVGYVYQIKENFAAGVKLSYIFSRLHSNTAFYTQKQATSYAGDVNLTYKVVLNKKKFVSQNPKYQFYDPGLNYFLFGFAINNLGGKLQYTDNDIYRNPLPTTIELGASYFKNITELNRISFFIEFKKLMVPTYPTNIADEKEFYTESLFSTILSSMGNGMVGTTLSLGGDYNYNDLLTFRYGYFDDFKENGQPFLSLGLGVKLPYVGIDVSYIIPINNPITKQGTTYVNPIFNTFRIGMTFDMLEFGGKKY